MSLPGLPEGLHWRITKPWGVQSIMVGMVDESGYTLSSEAVKIGLTPTTLMADNAIVRLVEEAAEAVMRNVMQDVDIRRLIEGTWECRTS